MELTTLVYKITQDYPKKEVFGLVKQTREASVSIPSNIAEGCGRGTNSQLKYFLGVAMGSACEVETQLYIAMNLEYLNRQVKEVIETVHEVQRLIAGFSKSLS